MNVRLTIIVTITLAVTSTTTAQPVIDPPGETACRGADVVFIATIDFGGAANPDVFWEFSLPNQGTFIPLDDGDRNDRIHIVNDFSSPSAVTSTLTIDTTDADIDAGTYRINSTSDGPMEFATADLDFYVDATVTPAANPETVCVGDITQLTSSPTDSGVGTFFVNWRVAAGPESSPGQFEPNPTQVDVGFEPIASGIYTIEAFIEDGFCDADDTETITVTVKPELEANPGPDDAVTCQNLTVLLDANPAGGSSIYTYVWSINSGPDLNTLQFANEETQNPTFTPADEGVYVLQVEITDDDCINPVINTMTLNVDNTVAVTAVAEHDNICLGGSTDVSADITPDDGLYDYDWTITDGPASNLGTDQFDDPGAQNVTFTPTASGMYTLRVVVGGGLCSETDTVNILVREGSDVAPSSDLDQLCQNESTQLLANPVGGSQEGQTFTWAVDTGPNFSNNQFTPSQFAENPTFTPFSVGNYTLRVVIADDVCATNSQATVVVESTDVISSAPTPEETSTCVLASVKLAANPSGGLESYTYAWSIIDGPSLLIGQIDDPTSETPTFTPTSPTIPGNEYAIELVVSGSSCTDAEPQAVTITVSDFITLEPTADDETLCVGGSTRVRSHVSGPGVSVTWSIEEGSPDTDVAQFSSPSAANPLFFPSTAGTYTLKVDVSQGSCPPATESIVIEVVEQPAIAPTASAESTCINQPVDLLANQIGSDSGKYIWEIMSGPDTSITQLQNAFTPLATFTPSAAGDYEILLSFDDLLCNQLIEDTVSVTVLPPLTTAPDTDPTGVTAACQNEPLPLMTNPAGGDGNYTYLWSFAFEPFPLTPASFDDNTLESPTFTATTPTTTSDYQLQVVVFDDTCDPSLTSVLTLSVTPPIVIDPILQREIVVVDVPIGIDAQNEGGGNVTYQWSIVFGPSLSTSQFDDTSIPNPTFTPSQLGDYRIKLAADDGVCIPVSAEIDFESTEGIISEASTDRDVICENETAQLSANPLGGVGNYAFAWTVTSGDNDPLQFSDPAIADPVFTPNAIGDYTIQVEITEDELPPGIGTIHLTVTNQNLVITSLPQPTTVCLNDDAIFSVTLANDRGVTYQWQRNFIDIPDANDAVLVVESASQSDEGAYRCVITGPCDSRFTPPVSLAVEPPLVQTPILAAVNLGGNPELNELVTGCTLAGGLQDAFSGDLQDVGRISTAGQTIENITGIAFDPADWTVYASIRVANTPPESGSTHFLARVQRHSGDATIVGMFDQAIYDIAIHPNGTLYAISGNDLGAGGQIYTVDKTTAELTETEIPVFSDEFGHTIAFDSQGQLYHHGFKLGTYARLSRIDLPSPTNILPVLDYTGDQRQDWSALVMRDDLILVSTFQGQLWSLDPTTFVATELGPIRAESGVPIRAEGLEFVCNTGDADCNGIVALQDFVGFSQCAQGVGTSCESFDADGSGDIALPDFGAFQNAFTGP